MTSIRRGLVALYLRLIAAGFITALGAGISHAQCVAFDDRAPPLAREMFAADPPSLLRTLRNENDKIEARLANYVATDPGLLPSVRKLVAEAPTSNKRAIGAALRKAELQCMAPQRMEPQPDAARKIIDFVRNLGDNAVLAGYVAVAEEAVSPKPIGKSAKPPARNDKLLTGEWKTELADPFATPPLPQ
jgi:hypothetical protein